MVSVMTFSTRCVRRLTLQEHTELKLSTCLVQLKLLFAQSPVESGKIFDGISRVVYPLMYPADVFHSHFTYHPVNTYG